MNIDGRDKIIKRQVKYFLYIDIFRTFSPFSRAQTTALINTRNNMYS